MIQAETYDEARLVAINLLSRCEEYYYSIKIVWDERRHCYWVIRENAGEGEEGVKEFSRL